MFSFAKKLKDKLEGSSKESDSYFRANLNINNAGHGLRVLYVTPDSTAQKHQFEAWFDYIVGINGHDLPMKYPISHARSYSIGEDGSFSYSNKDESDEASMVDFDLLAQEFAMAASGPHKIVTFKVWSAKGGVERDISVQLTPSEKRDADIQNTPRKWHLHADLFTELGLTVSSQHLNTATQVWKILNTHPHSPAFQALLVPYSDYIIGCDSAFPSDTSGKGLLAGGGEHFLATVVSSYYTRHNATLQDDQIPITFYVYNHDFDVVRPVTVYLSRGWAPAQNKGILGCDVGYGLLHRLPAVPGKFALLENETSQNLDASAGPDLADRPDSQNAPPAAPFLSQSTALHDTFKVTTPAPVLKSKPSNRYAPESVKESSSAEIEETPVETYIEDDTNAENVDFDAERIEISEDLVAEESAKSIKPATNFARAAENVDAHTPIESAQIYDSFEVTAQEKPASGSELQPDTNLESGAKEGTQPSRADIVSTDDTIPATKSPQDTAIVSDQPLSGLDFLNEPETEATPALNENTVPPFPGTQRHDDDSHTQAQSQTNEDEIQVGSSQDIDSTTEDNKDGDSHHEVEKEPEIKDNKPAISVGSPIPDDLLVPPVTKTEAESDAAPFAEVFETVPEEKSGSEDTTNKEKILPENENNQIETSPKMSKIDSLLEEDEDFLDLAEDEVSVPQNAHGISELQPAPESEPMCEIPLDESKPPNFSESTVQEVPQSPSKGSEAQVSPSKPLFSPMKSNPPPILPHTQNSSGVPLTSPVSKPARRRKAHGPSANLGSLADFMNEELSRSKANDVSNATRGDISDDVPPPPPKVFKH
ncbi:hypothetical protein OY671_006740 [Metschnikowia pulcherrima]|nr:hypothetical protein OY671_006740 [Metschnikowia pulcherrima]